MSQCTYPKKAWRAIDIELPLSMKRQNLDEGWEQIEIPCRRCDPCLNNYSNEWAIRCALEIHMHEQSTYITTTYDGEHLPEHNCLNKKHITDFYKRLRKYNLKHHGNKIRYLHCGEYGTKTTRPHYHAIIFGMDFPDKQPHGTNKSGDQMWRSDILDKIWGKGLCTIGTANVNTANYVASYITKKQYGVSGDYHYTQIDEDTGEIYKLIPEFLTMSRRPGLGHSFYKKYFNDIFPMDEIVIRTKEGAKPKRFPIPQYFYDCLKKDNPEMHESVKQARIKKGIDYEQQHPEESSPERRRTKAFIYQKNKNRLERPIEGKHASHHIDMSEIDRQLDAQRRFNKEIAEEIAEEKHQINKHHWIDNIPIA